MTNEYQLLSRRSRAVVLVSFFGLLAVFTVSTLIVPSCNRNPNVVIWVLHILPLLMFLPSILQQNVRAHAWLTFVLLGHFMASVSTAFACTSALMLIEVALISVLFIAAMLYIRWRSRETKFLASNAIY
ncbi:MAG: DUF2069 domain-containing protein [Pseudomonadales bacterium]